MQSTTTCVLSLMFGCLECYTISHGSHPPSCYMCACQVLLVGDSGVGKTCLLLRFISNKFEEKMNSTVGELAYTLMHYL